MNGLILSYMITFASAFWFDRWSKKMILKLLTNQPLFLNNWLNFSLQWNHGISFSWFSTAHPWGSFALIAAIIAVIILFCFYSWGQYKTGKLLYGESLVLAGALSNLVDRFQHGAVVDFIDFHLGTWHFATFNIADVCICLGISWLMLNQIKEVYDAAQSKKNS